MLPGPAVSVVYHRWRVVYLLKQQCSLQMRLIAVTAVSLAKNVLQRAMLMTAIIQPWRLHLNGPAGLQADAAEWNSAASTTTIPLKMQ
jgi:hypothetical protein